MSDGEAVCQVEEVPLIFREHLLLDLAPERLQHVSEFTNRVAAFRLR
jgi:hypothetical protein